ncbi:MULTISPECIES: glutaredoxin [Halorhodospira]|uniref:glutaredoxin family protein n=1 Tax=Halorhodospira TaxID=85108 RepID=UPI001EE99E6F|nr:MULTISPECIES: glutaredoxin [Halorhodospira]MCG5528972.1 glutaredoxin [Halorhodospira halophila]MCG5544070.1 glutaredoxin [Halorhodospira sp. 9628]
MSDERPAADPSEQRRLQRRIDRAVAGLVLYERSWCPFCMRVNMTLRSLGIELERRDIGQDPQAARELEEHGGKRMVPCLYIPDGGDGQWLYESGDIAAYLRALVEELGPDGRDG